MGRMAKAGAHVVGINCHFDPFVSLECLKKMKAGLDAANLKPYLMCQPLAFHTPDAGKQGFIDLPEFPFGLEPRICTRWEMHKKPWVRARARRAYWENMNPASGRPFCPAMSCPDNWGVTKGDAILVQQQEATRKEQIAEVQKIQMEKLKM